MHSFSKFVIYIVLACQSVSAFLFLRDSIRSRKPWKIYTHTLSFPPLEGLVLCIVSSYTHDVYGWSWYIRVNPQGPRGKWSCSPYLFPCQILQIGSFSSIPTPLLQSLLNVSDKKRKATYSLDFLTAWVPSSSRKHLGIWKAGIGRRRPHFYFLSFPLACR